MVCRPGTKHCEEILIPDPFAQRPPAPRHPGRRRPLAGWVFELTRGDVAVPDRSREPRIGAACDEIARIPAGADRRGGLDRIVTGLVVAGLPYEAVDQLVGRDQAAALDQLAGHRVAAAPVVARGLALVSYALGVAHPQLPCQGAASQS